ncbi:movement protein [Mint virus 2]|uniref:Movement protein n=1 Tax=Mint virus 2 TaxID=312998 RepID=Q52V13_9VIRU|nr:movement protein [Mint virus 2]AAX07261.1 movement protein [Mint virus 2]
MSSGHSVSELMPSNRIGYGNTNGAYTGSMRFQTPMEESPKSAVQVFETGKGVEDVSELKSKLKRRKVYNMRFLEDLWPTQVFKSVVHNEIRVEDGKVDLDVNLIDQDMVKNLDPNVKPYIHLGCIAIAVIPHGRDAPGECEFELVDTRYSSDHGSLARFGCKMANSLSAFARFPGYFISSHDIKDGYTIGLRVQGKNLELNGGVRPMSIQVICIFKICGEEFKHRYALGKLPGNAYQDLLNAYLIATEDDTEFEAHSKVAKLKGKTAEAKMVQPERCNTKEEDTLVMSDVYKTIKELYPEHGGFIEEKSDQVNDNDLTQRGGQLRGREL